MRKSQVKQSTGLEEETKDLLTKNMNDEEEDTTENSLYIFDKDLKVKGKI